MEENLILLGMNLKKDPATYRDEYLTQLDILESFLNLPTLPVKQIKSMIFFIVKYANVEPTKAVNTLINSLDILPDYLTKRVVLNGLVILRQKKLIESKDLFRLIITHGNDLRYFLKNVQEFLDVRCYPILKDWYIKGTERQKSFCYFLLLVLFTKIHEVEDRRKRFIGEFRNKTEIECTSENEMDSDSSNEESESIEEMESEDETMKVNVVRDDIRFSNAIKEIDLEDLEKIICQAFFIQGRLSKTCCLYFLNRTEVKFDISKIKRGKEYGNLIYKDLMQVMDRDVKLMKLKIFNLFKTVFNIKKSVLNIVIKMINLENEDLKEVLDVLVASVDKSEAEEFLKMIEEEFVYEGQQEDIVVLGLNVLREFYAKFLLSENRPCETESCEDMEDSNESENNQTESEASFSQKWLEDIKVKILKLIENFQGNRAKPIHFAYKMLMKVVVKHEQVETPVSLIKRRSTKEEMNILRTKGREEIKRLRAETKRQEDQVKYKNKTKGRKQTTMAKYLMKPTKKKGLKKKQKCK